MVASLLLSLREGLEAALIIGIILGVLHKMDRPKLRAYLWRGAGLAALLSLLGAILLNAIGAQFEGLAEQLFEGTAMLIAAGLLTWMIFWMHRQARGLKTEIEANVQRSVSKNGSKGLFLLAFLAVGREGIELALFLTASSFSTDGLQTLLGAAGGLLLAALLGYLVYNTGLRLSLAGFFRLTNVLLILFAAGLAAHGVHEFNEAGLIPPLIEHVWDINPILDEKSPTGQILTALFGYNGNPSLSEVMAYVLYALIVWAASLYFWSRPGVFILTGPHKV